MAYIGAARPRDAGGVALEALGAPLLLFFRPQALGTPLFGFLVVIDFSGGGDIQGFNKKIQIIDKIIIYIII